MAETRPARQPKAYPSVRNISKSLAHRDMRVVCLTPEQVLYPINIASGDHGVRTASIEIFKRGAQICAQLGSPYLFMTPGRGYEEEAMEEGWKRSAESLCIIGEYAASLGVPCLFESLQRFETNLVKSLEDMRRMANDMDDSNYRFVLDTCAMSAAGDTIDDYFKAFPGKIAHVHLVDGTPSGHLAWGDGELPMYRFVKEFEKNGYDGLLTFEVFGNGSYALRPKRTLERCLAEFDKATT